MKNNTVTADNCYQENFRLAKKLLWDNRELEKKAESILSKTRERMGLPKPEKP